MLFKWIFDYERTLGDKFMLTLLEHGGMSARQFCMYSGWTEAALRGVIYRIKKDIPKEERNLWIQNERTPYSLDKSFYFLGESGVKYCSRILGKRLYTTKSADQVAQSVHTLGINEILVRLIQAGVNRNVITWLATSEASDSIYRMRSNQDDSVVKKDLIRPDARLILNDRHKFWIEYDNVSEGPNKLETKQVEYINILEPLNHSWIDQRGNQRPPIDQSIVIWVTRDEVRRKYLENIWKNIVYLGYQNQWVPTMKFFTIGQETDFIIQSSSM